MWKALRSSTEASAQTEWHWVHTRLYPTPGYCGEIIHMYLATDLEFGEQNPDEDEFLEVYKIPLEKAVEMVMNGELRDSKTQTMVLKINQLKNEGKI